MKIAVSRQIYLMISTTLSLVELCVAGFGLLLACGGTDEQSLVGILQ